MKVYGKEILYPAGGNIFFVFRCPHLNKWLKGRTPGWLYNCSPLPNAVLPVADPIFLTKMYMTNMAIAELIDKVCCST